MMGLLLKENRLNINRSIKSNNLLKTAKWRFFYYTVLRKSKGEIERMSDVTEKIIMINEI